MQVEGCLNFYYATLQQKGDSFPLLGLGDLFDSRLKGKRKN